MNILLRYVVTFTVAMSMTNKLCQAKPVVEHHVNHRRLRQARIRAIQQEILSKLGLTHVPDSSKFNTTVEEMRSMYKLYKKSIADNKGRVHSLFSEEEFYAKRFHSFTDDGAPPVGTSSAHWQSASSHLLHFPVDIPLPPEPNKETAVYSATLKLFKLRTNVPPAWAENAGGGSETIDGPTTRINVYQLLEPMGGGADAAPGRRPQPPRKRLLDSRLVSLDGAGWEDFTVKVALQDWIENPGTNHGLEVVCVTCVLRDTVEFALGNAAERSGGGGDDGGGGEDSMLPGMADPDLAPTLNVYTQDKLILGRQKRSQGETYDCVPNGYETRCCRYKLEIDFREIGWNWIIEPKSYQAYYCKGSCPHRYKSAHRFATIQSMIHQLNPAAAPAPCCTATKLEPIQLMHFGDDGRLMVSSHEDMLVTECKCA